MNARLNIEALRAEISNIESLLAALPPQDILGGMALRGRLSTLHEELNSISAECQTTAETLVFFGGDPVSGSHGIDTEFAATALKNYQNIISSIYADTKLNEDALSEAGQIPFRKESALIITGMPRGSFGFKLEERADQCQLTDTALCTSIEKANKIFALLSTESEEKIDEMLSEENARVINHIKSFIETLSSNNASARLVSRDTDISIQQSKIKYIHKITENIEKTFEDKSLAGTFLGARKASRDFDFITDDGILIKGRMSKDIEERFIATMNTEYQDKHCTATITLHETKRKNSSRVLQRWTLKDIHPSLLKKGEDK